MAQRAGILQVEARELLQLHKEHYRTFWAWAEQNVEYALAGGVLSTPMGWQFRQGAGTQPNDRSLLNWPMQSTGAVTSATGNAGARRATLLSGKQHAPRYSPVSLLHTICSAAQSDASSTTVQTASSNSPPGAMSVLTRPTRDG